MYCVMQSMTRTSQQVRRGVLELERREPERNDRKRGESRCIMEWVIECILIPHTYLY